MCGVHVFFIKLMSTIELTRLSTVAGAIIASASVEANFGITLKWKEASEAKEGTVPTE
jgi:hypothetical protein